jgi:HK97 gp10 family phage protein
MSQMVFVEGFAELKESLRSLPDATAKNVLRRVEKTELQRFADTAKAIVPRRSGKLARSITVSTKLSKRQRSLAGDPGDDVITYAGVKALPYAHIVEFGSKNMRAQPYLRPAWEANKAALFERVKASLWLEIQKSLARYARKQAKLNVK